MSGSTVELIMGPMAAGKTSRAIQMAYRARAVGIRVLLAKHTSDQRAGSPRVETHDALALEAVVCTSAVALHEQLGLAGGELVIIDEGQFWGDDLPAWMEAVLRAHAPVRDLRIVVTALSGDYMRRPWPTVGKLVALASKVHHLTALCTACKREAAFTARIVSGSDRVLLGGMDAYAPRCAECWYAV